MSSRSLKTVTLLLSVIAQGDKNRKCGSLG